LPAYPGLSPIIRSRHGVVCRTFVGHRHYLVRAFGFLASLGSLVWLALSFQWLRGIRKIPVLEDVLETDLVDRNPAISIILAARDEERSVKESVASMLAQDYPGMLEVIAVNDRSTDRTARSWKSWRRNTLTDFGYRTWSHCRLAGKDPRPVQRVRPGHRKMAPVHRRRCDLLYRLHGESGTLRDQ
jgi:cellulose synthase/poly-beta-1,6-N-acetylglucosamine synthase-like glycosyltransferase